MCNPVYNPQWRAAQLNLSKEIQVNFTGKSNGKICITTTGYMDRRSASRIYFDQWVYQWVDQWVYLHIHTIYVEKTEPWGGDGEIQGSENNIFVFLLVVM